MIFQLCVFVLLYICSESVEANSVAGAAVFNGKEWVSIKEQLDTKSPHPSNQNNNRNEDIFVGILNYRDPRCGNTIQNLFSKAKDPNRVHIGLVQERSSDDAKCVKEYCKLHNVQGNPVVLNEKCPRYSQIRTMTTSQFQAKSFSRGRYLVSTFLRDEEYCLSVDPNVDGIAS